MIGLKNEQNSFSTSSPLKVIISILLHACYTWTLTTELQRRINTVEMRCYSRVLYISHKITNAIGCNKILTAIGPYEEIYSNNGEKRKLRWFGHVLGSCGPCRSYKAQFQGKGKEEGKRKDRRSVSGPA